MKFFLLVCFFSVFIISCSAEYVTTDSNLNVRYGYYYNRYYNPYWIPNVNVVTVPYHNRCEIDRPIIIPQPRPVIINPVPRPVVIKRDFGISRPSGGRFRH